MNHFYHKIIFHPETGTPLLGYNSIEILKEYSLEEVREKLRNCFVCENDELIIYEVRLMEFGIRETKWLIFPKTECATSHFYTTIPGGAKYCDMTVDSKLITVTFCDKPKLYIFITISPQGEHMINITENIFLWMHRTDPFCYNGKTKEICL